MIHRRKILVNLRLFDGEGEEGQAGSEIGAASASQSTQSEVVVYGRDDDIGTEQPTTEESSTAQEEKPTPDRAELYKQFKEEYKDMYTNDFNEHFNRRFKDHKAVEGKVNQYEPIINSLMKFHGVNDIGELSKIIDDDVLSEVAAKEGFSSVGKYKEYLQATAENQSLKQAQEKLTQDQKNEARLNGWIEEGLELKKSYPTFDLAKEFDNKAFTESLTKGLSVEQAYKLAHMDELLSTATADAAKKAEKSTVENIKSKGKRILENGVMQSQGVVRKSDPSKFTEADFREIERRVARGEKIYL